DNLEDNVLAQNNDWENNILAQDGLENICAAFAQMMQNLLECLKDPTNNGDNLGQGLADHNSAGHILEELPLDPPIQQLGSILSLSTPFLKQDSHMNINLHHIILDS
ncbi:hypothetical protein C0993_001360, partial [Termitomyces sp. T159_Od127]